MIKIISNIADVFSKEQTINYAKDDSGAIYVSNRYFLGKISQKNFGELLSQLDRHRRKSKIELVEQDGLLKYANEAKGNFEVSTPYEWEQKHCTMCVFADNKQHFAYNKNFVDVFDNGDNRMFVDDNSTYDIKAHNLVIKDGKGEFVGLILPIRLSDEDCKQLNDVLPLENGFKTKIEQIKENPTNDPYIGKEFFDGRETHIISAIQKSGNTDLYVIPTVTNGEFSRHAGLIDVDNIESQIELWEANRIYREKEKAEDAIKSQQKAEEQAVYENTDGYADNQAPMQKAKTLKALNDIFPTEEYGRLNVKEFIKAALTDGKTLEVKKILKEKYTKMDTGDYLSEIYNTRDKIEINSKLVKVHHDKNPNDNNALWLKENHPFLHYCYFHDKSVLPEDYFKTEYRLALNERESFKITKTAYDYGNYLIKNSKVKSQHEPKKTIAEQMKDGAAQAAKDNSNRVTPPKKAEKDR